MSTSPATIVVEPHIGGRIYERAADGAEHAWGEVLLWDPPRAIRWNWHLFFSRAEATQLDVTFTPSATGTAVRLVQSGWDARGEAGPSRRERTVQGWTQVTAGYRELIRRETAPGESSTRTEDRTP